MPYLLPATDSPTTRSTNLAIIQRLFHAYKPLYSPLSARKLTLNFDPNEATAGIAHFGSGVAENIDRPFPAAAVIQAQLAQLLSERGLQLNSDELFEFNGVPRRELVNFFRELLAKQLCLDLKAEHEHLPDLANRLIVAKAEKAINTMHEPFLQRIIDQQTLAPVFDDIDVPGDGNCFYYAALAALITNAFNGAITPASQATKALCAPTGFFANIQARLRADDAHRGFTFQQPQSVAACFQQLLQTFQDNPYALFEAIMVPALRASISDYAETSHGAVREQIVAHIQRLKQDPENLLAANAAAYHINESALSAEEFAAYYADVRDVGNQHPLGGPTEGAVLEFMLGVNCMTFDAKATQAPLGRAEANLYIRNTGVHFHVGLLKSNEPGITQVNQYVSGVMAQTINDWQQQQPQKAAAAFELQPFYDAVQTSLEICQGGTADDYLWAIGQVKALLNDAAWPLLDVGTQQRIADAIQPLINYIQTRSSRSEVVDQLAQLRPFTVIAAAPLSAERLDSGKAPANDNQPQIDSSQPQNSVTVAAVCQMITDARDACRIDSSRDNYHFHTSIITLTIKEQAAIFTEAEQQTIKTALEPFIAQVTRLFSKNPEISDALTQLSTSLKQADVNASPTSLKSPTASSAAVIANTTPLEDQDAPQQSKRSFVNRHSDSGLQQNRTKVAPRTTIDEGGKPLPEQLLKAAAKTSLENDEKPPRRLSASRTKENVLTSTPSATATLDTSTKKPPALSRQTGVASVTKAHDDPTPSIEKPLSRLKQSLRGEKATPPEKRVVAKIKPPKTPEEIAAQRERLQALTRRLEESQAKYAHLLPPAASSTADASNNLLMTHSAASRSATKGDSLRESLPSNPALLKKKTHR